MKPKKRQKMCCHCEGEVDLDVIVCPYCAADLREEKPEQMRSSYNPTTSVKNLGTQQSLYPPHYAPKTAISEEEEAPAPAEPEQAPETRNILSPVLLLSLGAQLFLLGLLMLLFSHKGMLLLKWDAKLWFVYIFASVPLLIFGYRAVSKV